MKLHCASCFAKQANKQIRYVLCFRELILKGNELFIQEDKVEKWHKMEQKGKDMGEKRNLVLQ